MRVECRSIRRAAVEHAQHIHKAVATELISGCAHGFGDAVAIENYQVALGFGLTISRS